MTVRRFPPKSYDVQSDGLTHTGAFLQKVNSAAKRSLDTAKVQPTKGPAHMNPSDHRLPSENRNIIPYTRAHRDHWRHTSRMYGLLPQAPRGLFGSVL